MSLSFRPRLVRDSVLIIGAALLSAGIIFGLMYDVVDGTLRRWTEHDLGRRAGILAAAIAANGEPQHALDALSGDIDVAGAIVCTPAGSVVARTRQAEGFGCESPLAQAAMSSGRKMARGILGNRSVIVTAHATAGGLRTFIVQDRAFLDLRRKHLLQILFAAAELALLALLLLARAGARIGSRRTEEAARDVVRQMRSRTGETRVPAHLRLLVRDMEDAVEELSGRHASPLDGAGRLRAFVAAEIPARSVVVIANREPYAHERDGSGGVEIRRPASGLVTAIEPVLRTCGGTWIAYGGGSADREYSDRDGRLAVPPEHPDYTLRRVWLDEDEYDGYYSGLANDALWPLCHAAYTKPSFRESDWSAYQRVNETFAKAAIEESSTDGMLLIQDYHFALVPRFVRGHAPHLVTSIFWHIPWPAAETFGICPWKETLLDGMIGADIVGFHTRRYCLNFLETVQRFLECRVDFEDMSVTYDGHRTLVKAYPISVEWPYPAASRADGAALRLSLGIPRDVHVCIGVDRADYTKGLLERIAAVELLLERNPSLVGKYVLVQLASPTRTGLRKYRQLIDDVEEAAGRVNARFATATWKPIVLQMRTFSADEVRLHYAMADSALVTPLHDGMNLVAKEYAAACTDGDGALVLSSFTGAAKELEGALLVNPYDAAEVAEAILRAVRMPLAERRARMKAMRDQIASNSIYEWSVKVLADMRDARERHTRFWPQRVQNGRTEQEVVAG